MKNRARFIGITVLCLGLLTAIVPRLVAGNLYYSNLNKWNYIFYQVLDYNETAGLSYFTDYSQSLTVMANRNSHILYEFQSIAGKGPSPYDPNKIQAYGNLYFGNLTRRNATMYEIASNLALSIYPWFPGFLTSVNWTRETQLAQTGANTLMGTLTVTNITQSSFGTPIPAIRFDFKQNNYFQNTTLVYALATGALLSADAVVGNYKLKITALSSNITTASLPTPLTPIQIIASLDTLSIALILATRHRKTPKAESLFDQ